ncbi:hypothetical protein VTJ83DRAFT_6603 [Remersonia thermophila]|uniref:Uncharacterized protein n=1 Tax=Remersonia thermophila TaxID=72144 RepID=A0ABR4D565_9PEZI
MDTVLDAVRSGGAPAPVETVPTQIATKMEPPSNENSDIEAARAAVSAAVPSPLPADSVASSVISPPDLGNQPTRSPPHMERAVPETKDLPQSIDGHEGQEEFVVVPNHEDSRLDDTTDVNDDASDLPQDEGNEDLTPPPDSPADETLSSASSAPAAALHDEIVVGTKAHTKASPIGLDGSEDTVMGDPEDRSVLSHKRKRPLGSYAESVDNDPSPTPTEDLEVRRVVRPAKPPVPGVVKGVLLGYWRDSPAEDEADKHAVVGFIDVRDRLRTRIQPTTRDGRPMDHRYPIPPGPGGSWVTFDKVAFDAHLVGHNHHVIKEYVKIRSEDSRKDDSTEERINADLEAIALAAERVRNNPPPDAPVAPQVAYGPEIPANAVIPNRPEAKRRRLVGSFGVPSDSPKFVQNTLDDIPGKRPTRVLIGYWKHSSEEDPANKHAVFGVLGSNDMFRVKLTRETRDGRTVIGNFPSGAGALWIHWDEVEFEPHLRNLSRNEVKEYCRVRQRQLDLGETPAERVANETKAVYEAQQRVIQSLAMGTTPVRPRDDPDLIPIAMKTNGHDRDSSSPTSPFASARPGAEEPRQPRRSDMGVRAAAVAAGRHPLPDVGFRAANRTPSGPNPEAIERTNQLARREIARLEAAQARADMRAASREASLAPVAAVSGLPHAAIAHANGNGHHAHNGMNGGHNGYATTNGISLHFQDNVERLNKVWESQEANRIRAGNEDAKIHMGIKYQRKQSGPFQGKLVSQGVIITIDGEDYVEYRVLTKPTFF